MPRSLDFSGGVRGKYAKALKDEGYVIRVYQRDGTFTERHVLGETAVIPNKRKSASRKAAGAERKPGARKRVKA